jgi:AcrR family transcriptional regulator
MSRRPYTPRLSVEDRRTQLLDCALEIIGRDGYGKVSIDAIAREADVTRPVVYRVFDDLPTLLFALLDRQEARALGQLAEAFDPGADPLDSLARLMDAVRADPATWRPILLGGDNTPPQVRERIDRDREMVRANLEAVIAGRARAVGVDPWAASHAMIAIAEHFGRLMMQDPEGFDPEPLLASVRALLGYVSPS